MNPENRMVEVFGQNLKNVRIKRDINQTNFAQMLNISQQRVSEWERGKVEPSLFSLVKIMNALDATFEELTVGIES